MITAEGEVEKVEGERERERQSADRNDDNDDDELGVLGLVLFIVYNADERASSVFHFY